MIDQKRFSRLFGGNKVLTGCIHLLPLPGSPGYAGSITTVVETAMEEAALYSKYGFDAVIVENFGDAPFYADRVPPETIASMSVVVNEVVKAFPKPVGVNILRNDALAALAVATVAGARFIRVNIHMGTRVTDQGLISGKSFETLRLRKNLGSNVLIFADAGVKHSYSPGHYPVEQEAGDLVERGMADAIILTGEATGKPVDTDTPARIRSIVRVPVIIGSGTTPGNLASYLNSVDGVIVGSYLKKDGLAANRPEEERVARFAETFRKTEGRAH